MRPILLFYLVFSYSFLSGQEVLDYLGETSLAIVQEDDLTTEFVYTGEGPCESVIINSYKDNDEPSKIYTEMRSDKFLFEMKNGKWYVMGENTYDDVPVPTHNILAFRSEDQTIVLVRKEEGPLATEITDFTVNDQKEIVFIDNLKNELIKVNLEGSLVDGYEMPDGVFRIVHHDGSYIMISEDEIIRCNEDMEIIHRMDNSLYLYDYFLGDEELLLFSDSYIVRYNTDDNSLVALVEDQDIEDVKIKDSGLFYMVWDQEPFHTALKKAKGTGAEVIKNYTEDGVYINQMSYSNNLDMVHGYHLTSNDRLLGVKGNYDTVLNGGKDMEIELLSATKVIDSINYTTDIIAKGIIKNNGSEEITSYVLQTDTYGGINCVKAFRRIEKELVLPAFGIDTFDVVLGVNAPKDEFCVTLLSANGDYINNSPLDYSCVELKTSTIDVDFEGYIIKPNPSSNVISVNYEFKNPIIHITDVNGQLIRKATGYSVNIADLSKGTYVVLVYDGDKIYRDKLIKL